MLKGVPNFCSAVWAMDAHAVGTRCPGFGTTCERAINDVLLGCLVSLAVHDP